MWRAPVVVTPAAGELIGLEEAKAHLKVDTGDDDALIATCLSAALAYVESVTGQRLLEQQLTVRGNSWADLANLPVAPVRVVETITYVAPDGTELEVPPAEFEARIDGLTTELVSNRWPQTKRGSLISVQLKVGYSAGAAPPDLVAAVKLVLGDLYANRESGQIGSVSGRIAMAATVENLLANHTIFLV